MHRTTDHLPKHSPSATTSKDAVRYSTERLPWATYLHATEGLLFLGCESTTSGKVRFVFEDPDRHGDQLELEFDRGATVSATALFASQKFLRRQMTEILSNRRNGVSKHHGFTE